MLFKTKNRKEKAKEEIRNLEVQTRRKEKINKEKVNVKWVSQITVVAFTLSFSLSFISETTIPNLSLIFGIILTLAFVFLGVLFDIIGVSVTSADEKVFHSMNSRKLRGSNIAVKMVKNAEKVSNFCCDVIGDICGIISGASAASIAAILSMNLKTNPLFTSLFVAATIAALTIGGKALGKTFAINKSNIIIYESSKFISYFYHPKKNTKKKK